MLTGPGLAAVLALTGAAALGWSPRPVARLRRRGHARPGTRWPAASGMAGPPVLASGAPVLAAGAVGVLVAFLSTPLVAALAAGCVAIAVRAERRRRRGIRSEARLRGLTEALGALAADLRSGRPFDAATDTAVRVCGDETTGRALARVLRAPGVPTPCEVGPLQEHLARVAAAVLLSARTGCSLAAVVSAVEDDLRERVRHRRELRSALAAPQASALLLAALPLLGLAMGSGIGAEPWRVLTGTAVGQVLLVTGVGLDVAGLAWSRRLAGRAIMPSAGP